MSKDPDFILEWPISKFLFWSSVSSERDNEDLLIRSVCVSKAVWEPDTLPKMLNVKPGPRINKTKEEIIKSTKNKIKKFRFKETSLSDITKDS